MNPNLYFKFAYVAYFKVFVSVTSFVIVYYCPSAYVTLSSLHLLI